MKAKIILILAIIGSVSSAQAYNLFFWQNQEFLADGKILIQKVIALDPGTAWATCHYADQVENFVAFSAFNQGEGFIARHDWVPNLRPSQFNSPNWDVHNPVTLIGIQNSRECINESDSLFSHGGGIGPIFAACKNGTFYVEDIPEVQKFYDLARSSINKARALGLLNCP